MAISKGEQNGNRFGYYCLSADVAGVSAGANPVSVTVHSLSKFWTYISGKLSGNYKTTQTAKTDPTASGTTITAISGAIQAGGTYICG